MSPFRKKCEKIRYGSYVRFVDRKCFLFRPSSESYFSTFFDFHDFLWNSVLENHIATENCICRPDGSFLTLEKCHFSKQTRHNVRSNNTRSVDIHRKGAFSKAKQLKIYFRMLLSRFFLRNLVLDIRIATGIAFADLIAPNFAFPVSFR